MGSLAAVMARRVAPEAGAVVRMLSAAAHRGPNHRTTSLGSCVVGISDSPDRVEGSLANDGTAAAAFTGSLDNGSQLADLMNRRGARVSAEDPASLVIAAFRELGPDFPAQLRGAFAAALTDGARLWCFRDQLGFRTLMYRDQPDGVYVATEAKQVAAGSGIRKEPDPEVLEQIYFRELTDETPSALKGVMRLPKATLLVADGSQAQRRRYWSPEDLLETGRYSDEEVQFHFDRLMAQAARRTLRGGDVVSLSGGIDSPAVAAYANPEHLEMTGRPISAISALYPDQPSVDESEYINLVADHLGIPLYTYDRTSGTLEDVQYWVEITDGPIPRLLLSDAAEHYRHVRLHGFQNMLTGEIAEFVFDMSRFLLPHLLLSAKFRALGTALRQRRQRGTTRRALLRQLGIAFAPRVLEKAHLLYANHEGLYRPPQWVDAKRVYAAWTRSATNPRRRWPNQQYMGFIGPGVAMEAEEVCQDIFGVRTRRPWGDVDLWEFFLSLPAEVKFPAVERKGLVRRLLRGRVPDAILDKTRKTVFNESIMARLDYEDLRRWLIAPRHRLHSIDYDRLADLIEREELDLINYQWARDLASTHAFLDLW